jgi:hypothetical protein
MSTITAILQGTLTKDARLQLLDCKPLPDHPQLSHKLKLIDVVADTPADPNQELPGFASLGGHGGSSEGGVISAVIMRECMKKWEYK